MHQSGMRSVFQVYGKQAHVLNASLKGAEHKVDEALALHHYSHWSLNTNFQQCETETLWQPVTTQMAKGGGRCCIRNREPLPWATRLGEPTGLCLEPQEQTALTWTLVKAL